MKTKTCDTCAYFIQTTEKKVVAVGQPQLPNTACRRYPPKQYPITTPQGTLMICLQPPVKSSDYCGEWKAIEQN